MPFLLLIGCSKPIETKTISYANAKGAYYYSSEKIYYAGQNRAYIIEER